MNDYYNLDSGRYGAALSTRVSQVMKRVYVKMFLAMLLSGVTAWLCAASPAVIGFFAAHGWAMWVVVGIELLLVISISGATTRLDSSTATLLFYLFAVVNGLMLFPIIMGYSGVSIAKTFFITAAVFGAMSVYGYSTNRDLSRWGAILFMCLIGLIIVAVVNVFLKSTTMEWIISGAGVLIFIGLTAWDTQQVRRMAEAAPGDAVGRLATLGALTLYLDFVNMFLFLLNFFGSSRD